MQLMAPQPAPFGISCFVMGFPHTQEKEKMIYKICLTGGPCAGKTTSLNSLNQRLTEFGYKIFCVPEAATLLNNGGAILDNSNQTIEKQVRFQINLIKTQITLEDIFFDIALSSGEKCLVLCDRGTLDGSAYISRHAW